MEPAASGHPGAGKVTIIRDEYGVPHVYARTARALFYGEGYATGQDRLWEAEVLRLTATGTVAKELGPGQRGDNVQSDLASRIYSGGATRLRALVQGLPAASRIAVQGYADGINGWISRAEATGKLPPEYAAFGFRPRPWTAEDVLAIWMEVGGQRGAFGSDELDNAADLAAWKTKFGPATAARLFADTRWSNDPGSPTTIPGPPGKVSALRIIETYRQHTSAVCADPGGPQALRVLGRLATASGAQRATLRVQRNPAPSPSTVPAVPTL